ncbi:HB2L protein, partial [Indicator maculatus]|nr:HB2L protein [Indicator maculatus]
LICPSSFLACSSSPLVQPEVEIYPVQSSSLPQSSSLVCAGMDFYPPEVEVKWFKNGQEETDQVVSTDVMQNGDWTYQVLVMLESTPERGDTYVCQVEHVSLQHPISQHWELQGGAGRSKMLTGVGGCVLGLVFLALGLFIYVRKKVSGEDTGWGSLGLSWAWGWG